VPSGPIAWALSKLYGLPYVLTAHLGDVPGGVPEKTGRWFRWVAPFTPPIWKGARRIAAVSEFTRQLALQRYPVDVRMIPNGVDLTDLDPGPICAGSPPTILFAGRFMPQKNPIQVVRCLNEVRHLPWRCRMLGDGPLLEDVRAEIAALGLQDRFDLPGWVSPDDVTDAFRHSDILFMPSLSEGLPVVGVRAISMGLAVVASDVGGFKDLVQHGCNGHLVDPTQPDGYTLGLRELLTDREVLQRSREASRKHAQMFDLENVVTAYENLFFEALGGAAAQGAPQS
jgi:glycosyltransferase involved in cell wall biosynthesis